MTPYMLMNFSAKYERANTDIFQTLPAAVMGLRVQDLLTVKSEHSLINRLNKMIAVLEKISNFKNPINRYKRVKTPVERWNEDRNELLKFRKNHSKVLHFSPYTSSLISVQIFNTSPLDGRLVKR